MVNIGIIGVGLVGSELISQLSAHCSRGKTPTFKVIALMNSTKQILSDSSHSPLNLSTWKDDLNAKGTTSDLTSFIDYLSETPTPSVVIDNTSSQEIANSYPLFIEKGLHIVTPNKKAFSGDLKLYKEIREKGDEKKRFIYYESTVGAGLPVLNTLTDLIRTGDKVIKIEGIFSGTLSYIFNEFSKLDGEKKKFSEIVKIAKANGYTEPDPRDDLNGLDVARKVVILGRLAGKDLTLDTLPVENIVPVPLLSLSGVKEFMSSLPQYDEHFEKLNATANSNQQVLRYVGVVDPVGNKSEVKLVSLPSSHPFAALKGSDNIVAFTTERFPSPLIIQGSGAGAAVTAFGIFSDLFKISERILF